MRPLSNCFGCSSVCFGSIETSKLSVSVLNRNNRNKRFVSDSAETSSGSSFGCFKSKLVSKDTLLTLTGVICALPAHQWSALLWQQLPCLLRPPSLQDESEKSSLFHSLILAFVTLDLTLKRKFRNQFHFSLLQLLLSR